MLTLRQQKNIRAARSYFREHLGQGDYYTEGSATVGVWIGEGAARLGLKPGTPVEEEAYLRLCNNRHPQTGESLTVRRREVDRRIFCDLTVSAPKSVSIMAITMGDSRIVAAHEAAYAVMMREAERLVATRVRRNGSKISRLTGNFVGATFVHTSSRALDPQLHSHTVVWNATFDPVEARWKAMETAVIFDQVHFLTAVYRNAFAPRLRELGYSLRSTQNGFEIDGVTPAVIERFSKGAGAIRKAVDAFQAASGIYSSNNARAAIAHKVRPKKQPGIPEAKLVAWQRSQMSAQELANLEQIKQSTLRHKPDVEVVQHRPSPRSLVHDVVSRIRKITEPSAAEPAPAKIQGLRGDSEPGGGHQEPVPTKTNLSDVGGTLEPGPRGSGDGATTPIHTENGHPLGAPDPFSSTPAMKEAARKAIDFARDHLFERRSVVKEHDLLTVALKKSEGHCTLNALRAELRSRGELLRHKDKLTTRAGIQLEQEMIRLANAGVGRFPPLRPEFEPALTGRAREAVQHLLKSRDQVMSLDGLAGTAKTTVLKELVRGLKTGQAVHAFSPRGTAVEVLKANRFPNADTVQSLLIRKNHADLERSLIVVDEAGLLSHRQMVSLLHLASQQNARLLLVGDHRQHGSVEAADALRQLRKESLITRARLRKIRRQHDPEYRRAVKDIALGRIDEGLNRLRSLNAIEVCDPDDRISRLASEYVEAVKRKEDALIVCPTWKEIDAVTGVVREELKNNGLLDAEETTVDVHRSLQWTQAQKRDLTSYEVGMVLTFHTPTRDFCRHDWAKVVRVEDNRLIVAMPNGQERIVSLRQCKAFDVARSIRIPISNGDKLLLMETRRRQCLCNGQIVTVKAVTADGTILTHEGQTIPSDYRALAYGFAVTSHRAQARTVDSVFVSVPDYRSTATNRPQFYVSISRATKLVRIFTADPAHVEQALARRNLRAPALSVQRSAARVRVH